MSDRRYSTAAWQRLRKAVLVRDGYVCQIQGPHCTLAATTCDHILPTSTHPHLFWAEENLRAACRKCNLGAGSRIAAANTRQTIERLQQIIGQQQQQIAQLLETITRYEDAKPAKRAAPTIR
jgi:5-methylcytosine-specific restriction endonuclease McrA